MVRSCASRTSVSVCVHGDHHHDSRGRRHLVRATASASSCGHMVKQASWSMLFYLWSPGNLTERCVFLYGDTYTGSDTWTQPYGALHEERLQSPECRRCVVLSWPPRHRLGSHSGNNNALSLKVLSSVNPKTLVDDLA